MHVLKIIDIGALKPEVVKGVELHLLSLNVVALVLMDVVALGLLFLSLLLFQLKILVERVSRQLRKLGQNFLRLGSGLIH